ncbi:unnamed protein product, partial [Laminaria digitata]
GIPREGFFAASLSTSINSQSTFQSGLTYEGGSTDIFGFDDGTRAAPGPVQDALRDVGSLDELPEAEEEQLGRTFTNIYNVDKGTLPPGFGITLTGGDSMDIFADGRLGAIASLKWGASWTDQERVQRTYAKSGDELRLRNDFIQRRTDFNSNIGGLLTVNAEWDKLVLASNTFYAHLTQRRAEVTTGF